jgi:hypothetical protein
MLESEQEPCWNRTKWILSSCDALLYRRDTSVLFGSEVFVIVRLPNKDIILTINQVFTV